MLPKTWQPHKWQYNIAMTTFFHSYLCSHTTPVKILHTLPKKTFTISSKSFFHLDKTPLRPIPWINIIYIFVAQNKAGTCPVCNYLSNKRQDLLHRPSQLCKCDAHTWPAAWLTAVLYPGTMSAINSYHFWQSSLTGIWKGVGSLSWGLCFCKFSKLQWDMAW